MYHHSLYQSTLVTHRDDHQISLQQPRQVNPADLENILVPRPPPDPSKGQRRTSANRARVPLTVGNDGTDQAAKSGYGDGRSI